MYKIETKGKNKKIIKLFKRLGYEIEKGGVSEEGVYSSQWISSNRDKKLFSFYDGCDELITLKDLKLMVAEKELKECRESKLYDMYKKYYEEIPNHIFTYSPDPTDVWINPEWNLKCCDVIDETLSKLTEAIKKQSKPKIEVGKVYITTHPHDGKTIMQFHTGKKKDYGFNSEGEWLDHLGLAWLNSDNCITREATNKEWLEALTKEADKKGGYGNIDGYEFRNGELWCNTKELPFGYCIMQDGVWADIIPEKPTVEIGEVYKVVDSDDDGFWMIGRVAGLPSKKDSTRCRANIISSQKRLRACEWCFNDSTRSFELASKEDIEWLDRCIEAKRYIERTEKKVLFTTEDGVKIYDKGNGVATEKCYCIGCKTTEVLGSHYDNWGTPLHGNKMFHDKDAAIAYIKERDKPKYEVKVGIWTSETSMSKSKWEADKGAEYYITIKDANAGAVHESAEDVAKLIEEALNKQ